MVLHTGRKWNYNSEPQKKGSAREKKKKTVTGAPMVKSHDVRGPKRRG